MRDANMTAGEISQTIEKMTPPDAILEITVGTPEEDGLGRMITVELTNGEVWQGLEHQVTGWAFGLAQGYRLAERAAELTQE